MTCFRAIACIDPVPGPAIAQPAVPAGPTGATVDQVPPKPFGQPTMAKADYHVRAKNDLTL
jgi:hypothetical protein